MLQIRPNQAAPIAAAPLTPDIRSRPAALYRSLQGRSPQGSLDRIGMTLSGLCLVHCVATMIIVSLLSAAGGWLGRPLIHEVGLMIAIGFGALALWKGIIEHGYLQPAAFGGLGLGIMTGALSIPHGEAELVYTLLGVAFVALGHDLNLRAASRLR